MTDNPEIGSKSQGDSQTLETPSGVSPYSGTIGCAPSVIVSMCDRTGNMLRPWADNGWECYAVDTQHSIRRERYEGGIHYVWGDARVWTLPEGRRAAFVITQAMCRDLACSGARDWQTKGLFMLADALILFASCIRFAELMGAPWIAENSKGALSRHFRPPDAIVNPYEYGGYEGGGGDGYRKETCLWVGNGAVVPPKRPIAIDTDIEHRIWKMPPSDARSDERAVAPLGLARAVYEANKDRVVKAHASHEAERRSEADE